MSHYTAGKRRTKEHVSQIYIFIFFFGHYFCLSNFFNGFIFSDISLPVLFSIEFSVILAKGHIFLRNLRSKIQTKGKSQFPKVV